MCKYECCVLIHGLDLALNQKVDQPCTSNDAQGRGVTESVEKELMEPVPEKSTPPPGMSKATPAVPVVPAAPAVPAVPAVPDSHYPCFSPPKNFFTASPMSGLIFTIFSAMLPTSIKIRYAHTPLTREFPHSMPISGEAI